jgi:hypothetical protein
MPRLRMAAWTARSRRRLGRAKPHGDKGRRRRGRGEQRRSRPRPRRVHVHCENAELASTSKPLGRAGSASRILVGVIAPRRSCANRPNFATDVNPMAGVNGARTRTRDKAQAVGKRSTSIWLSSPTGRDVARGSPACSPPWISTRASCHSRRQSRAGLMLGRLLHCRPARKALALVRRYIPRSCTADPLSSGGCQRR